MSSAALCAWNLKHLKKKWLAALFDNGDDLTDKKYIKNK